MLLEITVTELLINMISFHENKETNALYIVGRVFLDLSIIYLFNYYFTNRNIFCMYIN